MPEVKPKDVVKEKPAEQPAQTANVPAPAQSTAVTNWQDEMAKQAAAVAQQERPSSSSIGLRAGVLTYQGQPVPDNKLRVIILDFAYERTFYEGKFDANNIRSPVCFTLAKPQLVNGGWDYVDVKPYPESPKPQHPTCDGCPMDKWGSDPNGGRGKACQERRRLVLIPAREASQLEPDNILAAEVAVLKTPVTSVKIWGQYVNNCAALMGRPPFGVITELSTVPNAKSQFNLVFKSIAPVMDDAMPAIMRKRDLVQSILMKGYEPQDEKQAEQKPAEGKKY